MDNLIRLQYKPQLIERLGSHNLPNLIDVKNKLSKYILSVEDLRDSFQGVNLEIFLETMFFDLKKLPKLKKLGFLTDLDTKVSLYIYPQNRTQSVEYKLQKGNFFNNGEENNPLGIFRNLDNECYPSRGGCICLFKENLFSSKKYEYLQNLFKSKMRSWKKKIDLFSY